MAFYLRKGFNFGPIRINLSKSGLGVSAGVKGARLGVNSRGQSYVHGGRHGLYYRKNLSSFNPSPGGTGNSIGRRALEESEIFTDTGLTYLPKSMGKPDFSLPPLFQKVGNSKLVIGFMLIFIALFVGAIEAKIILGIMGAAMIFWNQKNKKISKNFHQSAANLLQLEPSDQTAANWDHYTEKIALKDQERLALHCVVNWLEKQIQEGEIIPIHNIQNFLKVEPKTLEGLILLLYKDAVESVLADHQLSEEEESLISDIEVKWNIATPVVQEEKKLIAAFKRLREIQFEELKPLDKADSDQLLYFEAEGRLLNLRVLDTWQQNRVRYKNMGYKLEMEGRLSISEQSFGITAGRDSRFYRIREVEDIYLSSENGVIEIFLQNRKSPVIISSPRLFEFSAILQKIVDQ
ncbi:Protein of unknown function [Belliella buryatensis]|uniref:DUF4236 domain-containing protein n=1 Tax=Belliella buryatensis TaxID=1500549 RepID=A0A239AKM4_9BACT|nr:DUF4236 domain-containing protein [Belliella buryatensis]SNR95614.1 Protein of unknown function [Belliella buryatensis]